MQTLLASGKGTFVPIENQVFMPIIILPVSICNNLNYFYFDFVFNWCFILT